jgi:three-Cys-motif partner protein
MLDDDGLPLDEVGPWAKEKHERLRKYVDITRAVRKKFVERSGGATYIDLYGGSGRALVRDTQERIDGSPLVAFKCAWDGKVQFSEIHIADASEDSCRAAERRLRAIGASPAAYIGEAEQTVSEIIARLNPHGLHFAFLDPYNLDDLPFAIIEAFSRLQRIDMLIHVSAQDLQRNLDVYTKADDKRLERFAPGWREHIDLNQSQRGIRAAILAYWASKIEKLGLSSAEHAELISGIERNQRLYWLVMVSRHKLAKEFWEKIRNVSGQGEFPL